MKLEPYPEEGYPSDIESESESENDSDSSIDKNDDDEDDEAILEKLFDFDQPSTTTAAENKNEQIFPLPKTDPTDNIGQNIFGIPGIFRLVFTEVLNAAQRSLKQEVKKDHVNVEEQTTQISNNRFSNNRLSTTMFLVCEEIVDKMKRLDGMKPDSLEKSVNKKQTDNHHLK